MSDGGYVFQGTGGWFVRPAGTQQRVGPFPSKEIAELYRATGETTGGNFNGG